jgi:hypothetical protein
MFVFHHANNFLPAIKFKLHISKVEPMRCTFCIQFIMSAGHYQDWSGRVPLQPW